MASYSTLPQLSSTSHNTSCIHLRSESNQTWFVARLLQRCTMQDKNRMDLCPEK